MEVFELRQIEEMLGGVVAGAGGAVPASDPGTLTVTPDGSHYGDHVKDVDVQ
jgi:hypothetical protein